MTETWAVNILQLLFGQLGAVGTLCVVFAGYMGWQLHIHQQTTKELLEKEQLERKEVLNKFEMSQEKRVELLGTFLHTISEFKSTLDSFIVILNGRK
jgi:hypothetical protein